jgi:hypothetical protein
MNKIENIIIIVVTVIITSIVLYFVLTISNQRMIDRLLIDQQRQVDVLLLNQEKILIRDKEIIDTLISKLANKQTYTISNDFNKIKPKKNSNVIVNLDNNIPKQPANDPLIIEPEPEKPKQSWIKRLFKR